MKYLVLLCMVIQTATAQFVDSVKITSIKRFDYSTVDQFINNYQFEKALQLLETNNDTLDTRLLNKKGYCFYRMGNYSAAIDQYERIIKLDSTNKNTLIQLAQLYSKSNRYEDSYGCYQKLIQQDSLNGYYYKQFAIVASQINDFLTSLANLQSAIQLNKKDIEAYTLLGNLLLEMEQYGTADTVLTQALKFNNNPQLRLLLAKAQFGEEKYKDVIKTTEGLMSQSDTLPVYARLLGISYFHADQFYKVIPFMDFLVKSDVKTEWVYYYLGVSYQKLDMPDTSIVYLNKAIEAAISDNISYDYLQLAISYEDIKDFKSAIKYYKAAYETTKSKILLYHLARNYDFYYKDKTQAIAYYKRYLNSDDTIKIAKEYTRTRLDELSVYR
jgi:tetratricopeptide (TPR) repeat protein